MKILKFRIKNFRSIIDSGDCYLTDNVTVLAGKNESGKTSILEALVDFDTDKNIRKEAIPIKSPDSLPEISIIFEIEGENLKDIFNEIGVDKENHDNIELEITKLFPDKYSISETSLKKLNLEDDISIKNEIEKNLNRIRKIHDKHPSIGGNLTDINIDDVQSLQTSVLQFKKATTPNLNQIESETEKSDFSTYITDLSKNLAQLIKLQNIETDFLNVLKEKWIPYFILFNSFDDIFPNKILFSDLETNEWINDLSIISDLDISKIKGTEDRSKHKHKKDLNISINNDYEKFWTQDISNLSIDWDSEHLYFWIEEDGYPYEPSLRSKGRQWHLAFYIKVSARAKEDIPNIILIDEPGLFLHAKAQRDILEKLEDSAKEAQVIFSTHSPYLLEWDKLNRIRLVHRTTQSGTVIENKIHALADKETLTPILTAIGLELNLGITHLDKINNVIVEGQSDLFYLESFKRISEVNDLNFVFGGGSGNMPFVGTILHGWGCKVIYLYDNDKGKKDGEKNLTKNWFVSKDLILSVLDIDGTIEDVFSLEDFKKYVLKDDRKYACKNSEYIKKSKEDKVLLSRLFLQSFEAGEVNLSGQSKENVKKLLKRIGDKFT